MRIDFGGSFVLISSRSLLICALLPGLLTAELSQREFFDELRHVKLSGKFQDRDHFNIKSGDKRHGIEFVVQTTGTHNNQFKFLECCTSSEPIAIFSFPDGFDYLETSKSPLVPESKALDKNVYWETVFHGELTFTKAYEGKYGQVSDGSATLSLSGVRQPAETVPGSMFWKLEFASVSKGKKVKWVGFGTAFNASEAP